ncbi:MAG TPA: M48 family metallopeptidase [Tepidisphaeraceae bacterium]|nr:M48 family metallopeptidase [Tepidisphaeraceae bacterium]
MTGFSLASWRLGGLFCLPLVAILAGGCAGPTPAAEFVRQADRLHDESLYTAVVSDAYLGRYVQEVGNRLMEAAQLAEPTKAHDPLFSHIEFHLVQNGVVNAYTTGGRHVYVYSALFAECDTEEELAAAMAHEYAHVLNLDIEKTGMKPLPTVPLPEVVNEYVNHRFTLAQERAADALAFELYARAGWDPNRFGDLFGKLARQFPQSPAADREPDALRAETGQGQSVPADWHKLPVADPRTYQSLRKLAIGSSSPATPEATQFLTAFPNCILSNDTAAQKKAQDSLRPAPPPGPALEPS